MIRKLFLVDDDTDDQEFFREALHQIDPSTEFITAIDGVDALEELKRMSPLPGVLFLDNNMPKMSGYECLKAIKGIKELAGIPVIIYSTALSPEFQQQCKAAGARAYLKKPDTFPLLVDELTVLLKHL